MTAATYMTPTFPETDADGRPLAYFTEDARVLSPEGANRLARERGQRAVAGHTVCWLSGQTCAVTGQAVPSLFDADDVDDLRP